MGRHVLGVVGAAAGLLWPAAVAGQGSRVSDAGTSAVTPEAAARFVDQAEQRLNELTVKASRAQWIQATYITDDTEELAADANRELIAATMQLAAEATRFDGLDLPYDVRRRLQLLKLSLDLPAPPDPSAQKELTRLAAEIEGMYGKGKFEVSWAKEPLDINAATNLLAESRKPQELLEVWKGWHGISPAMRPKYARFVELANQGAQALGYRDLGAYWRSKYDMPPEEFTAELDRLWEQVRPLYLALHAHARARLSRHYGPDVVAPDGPIPAHLLGNMWAQQWENVYPLVGPEGDTAGYDLTALLRAKNVDEVEMVRYGERFFTSLGFPPLPPTFWTRSLFKKPRDREVVCHASAWDIDNEEDLRIKMCIEVTGEDFVTIHHELGHNFYQRAYRRQPPLYRASANDGFHEAIGDAVALSVTPDYLVKIRLLERAPQRGGDVSYLLRMALDKVAFLPFGLLIDRWRWKVFSGEVTPADYNLAWWELRASYQGVAPPLPRSEADFDPGAKYHVPANVPYTRYFLAHILQFQFHRALCREAGFTGPLHQCSTYGNPAAGEKLRRMLEMGASRPWPEALYAMTGERRMDAGALLEYFAPLRAWLDEQNRGRKVGF